MANRRNPLNNDEVIVLFEDIEQDEVTSKTLDEYEVRNQATNHMFHALCKYLFLNGYFLWFFFYIISLQSYIYFLDFPHQRMTLRDDTNRKNL